MKLLHAPLWLLLLAAALLFPDLAASTSSKQLPVININGLEHRVLRAPVEFLMTGENATLENVQQKRFIPLTDDHGNQGISDKTFWLRLRLSNAGGAQEKTWVLHHETSYLDNLVVHFADSGADWTKEVLSDRRPFSDRPVEYRKLAFSHTTPAGAIPTCIYN